MSTTRAITDDATPLVPAPAHRRILDRYRGRARGPRSAGDRAILRDLMDTMAEAWDGQVLHARQAALVTYWWRRRPGQGEYTCHRLLAMHRDVSVYVSPTGEKVRVYVDGVEVPDRD